MLHLLIIFSINYTVLWLGQTDSWGNFSDCSGDWVPGVHPVYVNTWILNIICTRHSHCSFQTFCNNSVAYEERIFIKSAEFLETNGFYSLKLQVTVCTKRCRAVGLDDIFEIFPDQGHMKAFIYRSCCAKEFLLKNQYFGG